MPPFRSVSSARSNAALIPHLLRAVPRSARQRLQPTPLHRNSTTTRLSSTRTEPRLVAPSVARSPPPSGPSLETLQRWFFMAFALTTGALFGIIFRETVAPQPLPEPGSEKDAKVLTELEEDIDALDIVKELRGPGREERVMVHPWRPHPHRYSNPQADSAFFGWPAQEKAEEAKERRARKAEERRLRKKEGGRGPLHQDVKLDKLPTPEPQAAEAAAAPNPWIELDPPASGSPTSKPLLPSPPSPSSLSRPERLDSGTPFHSPFSPPNNPSTAATSYIPPSASASTSASKPPSPSSFPTRVPTPYTHSTLPGSRALGHFGPRTVQRTFYNPSTRELVQAVWLGGALSGWPGVVHGGAIATVLGEAGGGV
ncbi:hypothetical protein H2199_008386 [Coniosporium tulheliwenetii]|uniref:Uncharacterized protein n=1 Tax=Coniosporium tulheliwenetii TaxID=3383036 RepID=A0ACC2YJ99_9PEZI|nr:hypothetical protein H2199_008386 [Cladosporium sp. JES 115]